MLVPAAVCLGVSVRARAYTCVCVGVVCARRQLTAEGGLERARDTPHHHHPFPSANPTTLLRQLSRRCQAGVLDQFWPGTGAAGRSSLRTPSPPVSHSGSAGAVTNLRSAAITPDFFLFLVLFSLLHPAGRAARDHHRRHHSLRGKWPNVRSSLRECMYTLCLCVAVVDVLGIFLRHFELHRCPAVVGRQRVRRG